MKKLTACLLILALLAGGVGALAASGTISNGVHPYTFFASDDDIFAFDQTATYNSDAESRNVEMRVGDYAIITPIFRIDPQYLSYSLNDVTSSDPSVVDAQFYSQSNGDLGLRLHAKKPGAATVSASFSHYPTTEGAAIYVDICLPIDLTYTANVTVTGAGDLDIDLSASGGGYHSVEAAILSPQRLYDALDPEEQQAVQELGGGNMAAMIDEAGHADAAAASSALSAAIAGLSGGGSELSDGLTAYDALQQVLRLSDRVLDVSLIARYADVRVGVIFPQDMRMNITLCNNSTNAVQINGLRLSGDRNISFSSSSGPWGGEKELAEGGVTLQPGDSADFDVSACFRVIAGAGEASESEPIYTAVATTRCTYTDLVTGESGVATDTRSIPVYMTGGKGETVEDPIVSDRISRRHTRARRSISSAYGSRTDQMIAFSEPASLVISDAEGAELATITDEFDFFVDDNLTAYCIDGAKLVVIAPNAAGDYKITAKGISPAGMEILSYEYDSGTGMAVRCYLVESVSGEESFLLTTQRKGTASLCRLDAQGAKTPLIEIEAYLQQDITDRLTGMGLSDDEAKACSDLTVRGLIGEDYIQNLQGEMTLAPFCALMSDVAGKVYGIQSEETDDPVYRAMNMGLLTREEAEGMAEGPLTIAQAATLTDHLLEMLGFANGCTRFDWAISEAEAEALSSDLGIRAGLTYTFGICEGLDAEAHLTPPAAALLANRMLDAAEAALERDGMAAQIGDAYKQSLNWGQQISFVYGDEKSKSPALYGNAGLWLPDVNGKDALYASPVEHAIPIMFECIDYGKGEKWVVEKLRKKGYSLQAWPELSGVFCDETGAICRWTAMGLFDKGGKAYKDSVYLALSIIREGFGSRYLKQRRLSWYGGNANVEYYLVEDPQVVAALLGLSEAIAAPADSVSSNYEELTFEMWGDSVAALQAALIKLGYLKGSANSNYDSKTAKAVSAFQQAAGLEATGTADPLTQRLLYAETADSGAFRQWLDAHRDESSVSAADDELARRITGGQKAVFDALIVAESPEAVAKPARVEPADEAIPADDGDDGNGAGEVHTDKATVKAVQAALNDAGYNCGTPDGVAGKNTKKAISAYQTDNGLTVTGTVTDELLAAMGLM